MAEAYNPGWTKNNIIRHKVTGKPYKIIHVFTRMATLIVDLTENQELHEPVVLLPKDYVNYAKDKDMDLVKKNDSLEWEYRPLYL